MEVMILCVTIGILMCVSMFGLGLAIGRETGKHERVDKDSSRCGTERGHVDRSDNTVASMGVDRNCVYDDKGAVSVRGSDRQDLGSMDTEEIIDVLCTMKLGACRKERDVLDIMIRLVELIERIFMDGDRS